MYDIKLGYYRLYKGNIYQVFGVALYAEYPIAFVIYGNGGIEWARPYTDFIDEVEVENELVLRFVFLHD